MYLGAAFSGFPGSVILSPVSVTILRGGGTYRYWKKGLLPSFLGPFSSKFQVSTACGVFQRGIDQGNKGDIWNQGPQEREEITLPGCWVPGHSHIIVAITNIFETHKPMQNNVIYKERCKMN